MNALVQMVAMVGVLASAAGPALTANTPPASKPSSTPADFRLGGIHMHLFYESLGQSDERDLVADRFVLWNTIIGEGDAKAPSNTTMVVVDVLGPSFPSGTKGTISVTAKNGKRVLRRETVQLGSFFSEGPKLSIPFVVVGTGCGTLSVDVDLAVRGKTDRLARTIEYPCGN